MGRCTEHKVFQLIEACEFACKPHNELTVSSVDLSGREIEVRPVDRTKNVGNRKPVCLKPLKIEINPDFPFATAGQIDLTHTVDTRQLRFDIIFEQLIEVSIGKR